MSKNLAVKVCGRLAREAPDMLIALTTKNKAYLCFEAAIIVIDCCMTIYSFALEGRLCPAGRRDAAGK